MCNGGKNLPSLKNHNVVLENINTVDDAGLLIDSNLRRAGEELLATLTVTIDDARQGYISDNAQTILSNVVRERAITTKQADILRAHVWTGAELMALAIADRVALTGLQTR